jgi:glycosyltransferase involved in cell wall biosynthesis
MRGLHVAVLDEELPYPLTSGKRIRTFNLLARLASRHQVTVLCHKNSDRDEIDAAQGAFRELGIRSVVVDRTIAPKSGARFYARLAGNLFSPLPYTVASHTSPTLAAAIRAHAAEHPVDLWHCEWTPYAQVLQDALGEELEAARWTVMAHNVESQIWNRYTASTGNPLARWYINRQFRKFKRFERWAYRAATTTIAVSHRDAATMRRSFGARGVRVVENGVDLDYFKPQRDVERDPARMLFVGSLDWRPNQDAAVRLLDDVLPRVRMAVPHATALIVGRRPPEWLRTRVMATPGAELHADVPDVRPFLARCGFLIVPLRIGGGSRLKILEALAAGTPVVSTKVGAEGLQLTPGRDLLVVGGVDELVPAAIAAIRRPEELAETAENGRRQILARYSWDPLANQLHEIWNSAARIPSLVTT